MEIEELALASREPSGESRRDASAQLKERIKTVIDMESRSASMAPITPLYVSRMLNVAVEEVEKCMKEMGIS